MTCGHWWEGPQPFMPHSSPTCPLRDGGCDSLFILPYLHHLLFFTLQCSFSFASFDLSTNKYGRNYIEKAFRWFLGLCFTHALKLHGWSRIVGFALPLEPSAPDDRVGWGGFSVFKRGRVGREGWVSPTANGQRSKVGRDSITNREATSQCPFWGRSVTVPWEPRGHLVQDSDHGGDSSGLPTRSRSEQRRDLRPAVTQARQGGALRAVQSGESPVYVRVSACRRRSSVGRGWRGLRAGSHSLPQRSRSPLRVLKRLQWLRGILCHCDLRLPRQSWSGLLGSQETKKWWAGGAGCWKARAEGPAGTGRGGTRASAWSTSDP